MSFFKNKLMWIGFGIAAGIDLLNGLNVFFPSIPYINVKVTNLGGSFTGRPWGALGNVWLSFFPFAIGLGVLLPADLSFSCWFFHVFWRLQFVAAAALGWETIPGMPFMNYQAFGGVMAIALIALYSSRKALWQVLRRAVGAGSTASDEGEAMSYRTALLGVGLGLVIMLYIAVAAGMSLWVGFLFFGIYFLMSIALTRIHAELGPPAHDFRDMGPHRIISAMFGARALGAKNLVGNEPFAVLLGDDMMDAKVPAMRQILCGPEQAGAAVIGVFRVPESETKRYGIIDPEKTDNPRLFRIKKMVEKPQENPPSNLAIAGRYLLPPEIFECIERTAPGKDGEIQLTDAMNLLNEERREGIYAWEMEGRRYDAGNILGFLEANIAYAMKRPELKEKLRELLKPHL